LCAALLQPIKIKHYSHLQYIVFKFFSNRIECNLRKVQDAQMGVCSGGN